MIKLTFNQEDTITAKDYNEGRWDKKEIGAAGIIIKDTDTVMDIGANVGMFSVNIADKRKCQIYAFEPVPKTYQQLVVNVRNNGIKTIQHFNMGMSAMNSKEKMHTSNSRSSKSSLRDIFDGEKHDMITCHFRRIDDFCAERGITPNFIKCDVEGAELLVLYGGIETIMKHKPVIMCEIYPPWCVKFGYMPESIIRFLILLGYSWYVVEGYMFVPAEKRADQKEYNFFAFPEKTDPNILLKEGVIEK